MSLLIRTLINRLSTISVCIPHVDCWQCRKRLDCDEEKFFCRSCQIIQPPVKCVNYFQYLSQPIGFDLDLPKLSDYFRKLQRQLHPDRFTNRSPQEQDYSDQQSSIVNKAYSTLMQPLSRALYLLELHGKPLTEREGQTNPTDPDFLLEMMELNEKLVECRTTDEILKMEKDTKSILDRLIIDLSTAFEKENDVDKAKSIVIRMKFYVSLQEKVHSKLGLG